MKNNNWDFKITEKWLREQGACEAAIEKFIAEKAEGQIVRQRIQALENQKDTLDYIGWYFSRCNLTGIAKLWHKNGNIQLERKIKNGLLHGKAKIYDSNGNIFFITKWYNDHLIDGQNKRQKCRYVD